MDNNLIKKFTGFEARRRMCVSKGMETDAWETNKKILEIFADTKQYSDCATFNGALVMARDAVIFMLQCDEANDRSSKDTISYVRKLADSIGSDETRNTWQDSYCAFITLAFPYLICQAIKEELYVAAFDMNTRLEVRYFEFSRMFTWRHTDAWRRMLEKKNRLIEKAIDWYSGNAHVSVDGDVETLNLGTRDCRVIHQPDERKVYIESSGMKMTLSDDLAEFKEEEHFKLSVETFETTDVDSTIIDRDCVWGERFVDWNQRVELIFIVKQGSSAVRVVVNAISP